MIYKLVKRKIHYFRHNQVNFKLSKVGHVYMYNKKLHNLGLENSYECDNLDKVIFNYSSYRPSDLKKRFFAKSLNYALPLIKLNYGDYMTPFENGQLKIMNQKMFRQRLKREHICRLITTVFFWNDLTISKEEYLVLRGCTALFVEQLLSQSTSKTKKMYYKVAKEKGQGRSQRVVKQAKAAFQILAKYCVFIAALSNEKRNFETPSELISS